MNRTTQRQVTEEAKRLGVPVEVTKPGDGQTRYEFNLGSRFHFVIGTYAALSFLRGYEAAFALVVRAEGGADPMPAGN
jgi:hypothetical protein